MRTVTKPTVRSLRPLGLVLALLLAGCAGGGYRVQSDFDAQALGVPSQFPPPTPPADQFIWLSRQAVTATVEGGPGGGRWVRVQPTAAFLRDPDTMRQILLASSAPFASNPAGQMRGRFSLRLAGQGTVSFGIRATTAGREQHFIGGGAIDVFRGSGSASIVPAPAVLDDLNAFSVRPFPGTQVASYAGGRTVHVFFSVDHQSRQFRLNFGGGAVGGDSTSYQLAGPIAALELWLFLRRPDAATVVFVDDVSMEELR